MCNKMNILSKTLYGAIKHFRANDEEITVSVKTDKALLKNYFQNSESKYLFILCIGITGEKDVKNILFYQKYTGFSSGKGSCLLSN